MSAEQDTETRAAAAADDPLAELRAEEFNALVSGDSVPEPEPVFAGDETKPAGTGTSEDAGVIRPAGTKRSDHLRPVVGRAKASVAEIQQLPHSLDAEQAVLGALMLDNGAWSSIADQLHTEDFFRREHQLIYAAIAELGGRGEPFDAVLVAEALEHKGSGEQTGGLDYIAGLVRDTASAANVRAYADVVRERATRRRLHAAALRIAADVATDRPVKEQIADATAAIQAVAATPKPAADDIAPPRYLPWSTLQGHVPPPRQWYMSEWLTVGPTLCSGRPGIGKTSVAQTIASALATQTKYITTPSKPLVSLMWACEDDHDELWRRQLSICHALDIDIAALEDMFYLESRLGCDNTLFAPLHGRMTWQPSFERLRQQVNDVGADVLWLDNIGQTFGGNENERHPVTAYVNGLMGMRPNLAVVFLGHPARAIGSEFAGNGAWEAAMRMRWYFGDKLPDQDDADHELEDEVRFLCRRKANYTHRDYVQLRFRDGVFMPEQPEGPTFGEKYGGQSRQDGVDNIVLVGFDKCVAAGITPNDGPNSPDYLPRRLVDMKLNGGRTKKELKSAMHRLLAEGRFKRAQIGKYANRTPKMGLVKAEQGESA